jgi:uncharacterized membrane protein YhaH (DUF805 family)
MPQLLFSYQGRIGVKQFWLGLLSALASTIALTVVASIILAIGLIATGASQETQQISIIVLSLLIAGFAGYTQLAVMVKRLHDSGRSGWWCLITLIPFVGLAWVVLDLGVPRRQAKSPVDTPALTPAE